MRKIFLCFILLAICFQSCQSQGRRIKSYEGQEHLVYETKKEQGLWTGINEDKLIEDGIWIQFFKEDTLKPARIFGSENHVFNGIWKEFHFCGQISQEGAYRIGKKHGVWKEWYKTGQLKKEEYFVEGKQVGKRVSYYPNGIVSDLDLPNHLGTDSLYISYYENGKITKKRVYLNPGYKEKNYYSNGQVYSEQTYFDNRLIDTIQTYFHRNGELLASGRTKTGARLGLWKFFYKNGQLKAEGKYAQGTKEFCNNFYPSHYHYKTGYWKYWYDDGQPMADGRYDPILTKSTDGGIPEVIQIANKESGWHFWNQSGKEITELELYKMGLFKEYPPFYFTGEIEP